MTRVRPPWALFVIVAVSVLRAVAVAADEAVDEGRLETFLAGQKIDRTGRRPLEEATTWDDAVQRVAVKVLERIKAPRELVARWRTDAVAFGSAPAAVEDRLVAVRGRAVFVAPQALTPEQQPLANGRTHFDVVRIVDAAGTAADVLVYDAPRAWARGREIDEPAAAFGLPVSTGVGPRPDGWPAAPPSLVVAAPDVSWTPATPLGSLGMDYALFDTVVDGHKLEPGDTAAFYAMLAAVAKSPEAPPGKPTDIVPIIDPAQKWFARHRGDEVVIAGRALRVLEVKIDDPADRVAVGLDRYWQIEVFVPTPPLSVDGDEQDSFPVVCCVRELPPGMPTGDNIAEPVVVEGFAFKRYAWQLADATIGDKERKGSRRETALVIGRRAIWEPPPSTRGASDVLFLVFAGLAAVVALAIGWGAWTMRCDARQDEARARAERPERFTLPGDRG